MMPSRFNNATYSSKVSGQSTKRPKSALVSNRICARIRLLKPGPISFSPCEIFVDTPTSQQAVFEVVVGVVAPPLDEAFSQQGGIDFARWKRLHSGLTRPS
jgi:hypothetical protein